MRRCGAAALYGGPFLEGFYLKGADEFEGWVAVERGALANAAARTLERLAERAEHQGDVPHSHARWQRMVRQMKL